MNRRKYELNKTAMNLHQIIFSPTGGTRRVCRYLSDGMTARRDKGETVDLCVKAEDVFIPRLDGNDLSIIAMPVFAGRVPALAIERLRLIEGNNSRCVIVAVYGNRAYDDALMELYDVATALGFRVIAAIGAVAEHSIIRKYGQGRPDEDDIKVLHGFGEQIVQKVASGNDSSPKIPGNRPYKKPMEGPHPTACRKCNSCGICVKGCPAGAISLYNVKEVDKRKCISCMKCVADCPTGARNIGFVMNFLIARMIKKPCASRKCNELFL
ncbi:MAG: 4Fe-4S binding protein [Bacteroides sp.]